MNEEHPLKPFLPENARLLMLGSFPPPRSKWSMEFFYPNFINDMWRIFGIVFFGDRDYFLLNGEKKFDRAKIEAFLNAKGIALYDAVQVANRLNNNASDKFLEVVEPADLRAILSRIPGCRSICVTGAKSLETLVSVFGAEEPKVGAFSEFDLDGKRMRLWRMPSSSRAYPKPLPDKAQIYAAMFVALGLA